MFFSVTPLTFHLTRVIYPSSNSQVGLLIKRGADLDIKDLEGKDLLAIALERADADIVTL